MNYLFVAPRFHTNQFVLTKKLIEQGDYVDFLVQSFGYIEDHSIVKPVLMKPSKLSNLWLNTRKKQLSTIDFENAKIRLFFPERKFILHYLRERKPDLVILRDYSKTSMVVYSCCKKLGITRVVIYNQVPINEECFHNPLKRIIAKMVFPKIRISPSLYKKLKNSNSNYAANTQLNAFYVPIIEEVYEHEKKYFNNDFINILDVGKYRDYKNHFLLIEALKLLKNIDKVNVKIIGQVSNSEEQSYYDHLCMNVQETGLENINILKDIDYSKMKSQYLESDILVLASKIESFAMTVLEAMAMGLCVVCTDNSGVSCHVIESGGFVFDHNLPTDLANILDKLIKNPMLIKEAGMKAKEYMKTTCSIEEFNKRIACLPVN